MKTLLTTLAILAIAATVHAGDIAPVTYTHTATSNDVFVACYWVGAQFPDKDELSEKYLLLAIRKTTWQDTDNGKQTIIRNGIGKLLRGEVKLTKAKMQAWRDQLNDANIMFKLTDNPSAALAAAGLERPGGDEPGGGEL